MHSFTHFYGKPLGGDPSPAASLLYIPLSCLCGRNLARFASAIWELFPPLPTLYNLDLLSASHLITKRKSSKLSQKSNPRVFC